MTKLKIWYVDFQQHLLDGVIEWLRMLHSLCKLAKFVTRCPIVTLNCIRYSDLPLVHKGVFHGTSPYENHFFTGILELFLHHIHTLIITIFQQKNNKKNKMAAKIRIFASQKRSRDQQFPKEFSTNFGSKLHKMNAFTFLK